MDAYGLRTLIGLDPNSIEQQNDLILLNKICSSANSNEKIIAEKMFSSISENSNSIYDLILKFGAGMILDRNLASQKINYINRLNSINEKSQIKSQSQLYIEEKPPEYKCNE